MKLSCKFGGWSIQQIDNRKRNTKSFRQGCPFEIYITLSPDGTSVIVSSINQEHNHQLSKEIYSHLPRQRNLTGELKEEVIDAIRLKANSKLIQQKIETTTGRPVTLKDIANLKNATKRELKSNDLKSVIAFLKSKENSIVELVIDSDDNFKCLFYQDQYMRNI